MQQKRLPTWFVSSGRKRQQLAQWSPGLSLGLQGMAVILLINNLEYIAELKFGSQKLSQALPPQQPYSPHNNLASSAVSVFLHIPVSHCSVIKHSASTLNPCPSSAISAYSPFSSTPLCPFSPSPRWPVHARTGVTGKVHHRGAWLGHIAHLLPAPRLEIKEFSPQKAGFWVFFYISPSRVCPLLSMIWMLLPIPNPYYCRNQESWWSTWPDLMLFSHTLCSYSFWCRFVTGSSFQNMVCRPIERFVCGEKHSSLPLRGPAKGHFTLPVPATSPKKL